MSGLPDKKAQCLRKPDQPSRSVVLRYKLEGYKKPNALQLMKDRIDSPAGKRIYRKRLAIAEPPFGHMQEMGLTRFTFRGRPKVNARWQLTCTLHNLKKVHGSGGEKLLKRMEKIKKKR
ncbi:transposase [Endozoicomonas sp. SESOKO2]|uniref:transposase n=1 Tax=Endozoicomonas sp. SESOKO2 TaxID=2828743 RepID=UPI00214986F8|nr:transposase [Endozoicomonas sp. SESOKO2]